MKLFFFALFAAVGVVSAGTVFIEKAGITLDYPDSWTPNIPDISEIPLNACLPRLTKDNRFIIDAVLWRESPSLEEAVDQYVERLLRVSKEAKSIKIIERDRFVAASGLEGIRFQMQTSMTKECRSSIYLLRYVFRNSKNRIVCLGGFGDHEEIDKIVLNSVTLK